jgi:thiosulfate/3-mercaptopyruvate sulfurtransferase
MSLKQQIDLVENRGVSRRCPLAQAKTRTQKLFLVSALAVLIAASATIVSVPAIRGDDKKSVDPWADSQLVQPAKFAHELVDKYSSVPTVIYVGFRSLYAGGHIPGASYHGTASTEEGLADLKKWADTLPRTTELVIYCGCCPFAKCPNIRPGFSALDKMGFKKMRVIVFPTSFAADWAEKGYPIQKGS